MHAPEIYTAAYYALLHALECRHWWYIGMREIAGVLLMAPGPHLAMFAAAGPRPARRILDAGCGTGETMRWARSTYDSEQVFGIDIALDALAFCRSDGEANVVQGSVLELPFQSASFDLVICQDVLQHLPTNGGDVAALKEMYRILSPGGLLLIRSNSALGMGKDHAQKDEDFQLYRLDQLNACVEAAGFEVRRASYVNCLPALYASAKRSLQRRFSHPTNHHHGHDDDTSERLYEGLKVRDTPTNHPILNRILLAVLRLEARLLKIASVRLPFGHSTMVVGQRT